jgi:hypothetical protein
MNPTLINQFKNPTSEYRGSPFWAWNGRLEPEELRRQIRIMNHMGLGGFFMHSRVGLDTPYLSNAWFECIQACIDEAEQLNMQAWLYDEDRWPSGAAGGLVTKNPAYRHRNLELTIHEAADAIIWDEDTLGVFTGIIQNNTLTQLAPLASSHTPTLKPGESILQFRVKLDEPSSWYNDYTYLDTLNHEAVQAFIQATHERYREEVGDYLGKRVPGIFTDEPMFCEVIEQTKDHSWLTPWTGKLPEVFKTRYGYDLLPLLPHLFFDIPDSQPETTRYHYLDCITHLFVDAYAKQIGTWCDETGMLHTGHIMEEDTLVRQTNRVGSAMRFYEYMQAPGIDLLMEYNRIYDTAKQVSSMAHQFGRRWRLTETYGCTGWDFPFEGHKALGDWQVALGINLRCQHLSWYTMEGEAKRDYPAGIFYQSPWWKHYTKVEDYFARIHVVMTQGEEVRDILYIHPVESIWLHIKRNWHNQDAVTQLDQRFVMLRDQLLTNHLDFDYGEEEVLSRHARIIQDNGIPTIQVGRARYKAVVVPEQHTIRQTTLDMLQKFKQAGGTVVFVGAVASYVDGVPSAAAMSVAKQCTQVALKDDTLISALQPTSRRVSITDPTNKEIPACLYLLREDDHAYYLFICNTSHAESIFQEGSIKEPRVRERTAEFPEAQITLFDQIDGAVHELNPDTGEVFLVDTQTQGKGVTFKTSFPRLGSRLFVIMKQKSDTTKERFSHTPNLVLSKSEPLSKITWDIRLDEPNVLVLDQPEYSMDGGVLQSERDILQVDHRIREQLGVRQRGGAMVQPWARPPKKDVKTLPILLRYKFDVESLPSNPVMLGVEQPSTFDFYLNGYAISTDSEMGWWCDRSLRTIPFNPNFLKQGTNVLDLHCDYHEDHPGLELIYLLGDFGTRIHNTSPIMTAPVRQIQIGDWVNQGLTFYGGNVSYLHTLTGIPADAGRIFLRVPEFRGIGISVYVDHHHAGCIAWEPQEVELTDLIQRDGCELRIELIGHRRNSHGPLHLSNPWPTWTGPHQFQYEEGKWNQGYTLVPIGLMKPPEILFYK